MNQIVSIHQAIYIPLFDETLDKYIDKSPYKPYERNCIRYECRCKAGTSFISTSQFKQHIKSKTHQEYINNYENYNKELIALKKENINLRAAYLLLEQKNTKLDRALDARCVEVLNLEKNKEELMMIKKVFKLLTH